MKFHAVIFSVSLLVATAAPARVFCAQLYKSQTGVENLTRFGRPPGEVRGALPDLFRLLVWNVKKGEMNGMIEDFRVLGQDAHLVLFQEMVDAPRISSGIAAANPELSWSMARAFYWDRAESYTGVATGSRAQPLREEPFLSTVTEPILSTPKSLLVSEYRLGTGAAHLLVVNIHAINFVSQSSFREHIDQLVQVSRSHQGPLIVAGDFNTWSGPRMAYLERALSKLSLKNLNVGKAGWTYAFDHVFVRGLRLEQSIGLDHINSSDHKPLMVDLVYDPNAPSPLP